VSSCATALAGTLASSAHRVLPPPDLAPGYELTCLSCHKLQFVPPAFRFHTWGIDFVVVSAPQCWEIESRHFPCREIRLHRYTTLPILSLRPFLIRRLAFLARLPFENVSFYAFKVCSPSSYQLRFFFRRILSSLSRPGVLFGSAFPFARPFSDAFPRDEYFPPHSVVTPFSAFGRISPSVHLVNVFWKQEAFPTTSIFFVLGTLPLFSWSWRSFTSPYDIWTSRNVFRGPHRIWHRRGVQVAQGYLPCVGSISILTPILCHFLDDAPFSSLDYVLPVSLPDG